MNEGDPLDDLGRELRDRVGHEMRLEAEMVEQDAESVQQRRRTMADLAIELLSRGDTVTVIAGDRSIRGHVTYARGEIATVDAGIGTVDVHLAAGVVLRVDERATDGGSPPKSGSDSLRARIFELEMAGTAIELWVPRHGSEPSGSIAAVGRDHVIVLDQDGREWAVPFLDIAWIRAI